MMERTTTVESYDASINALKVLYPNGMAMVAAAIGEPPMPDPTTPQWQIDETLSTLERICVNAGLD
jgi:hypothetical protein